MRIGVIALGAALAFGVTTGAQAQASGTSGVPAAGAGGNTMGGAPGGKVTPSTPTLNTSNPNTVPQSNEAPVSPGTQSTSPGTGTH